MEETGKENSGQDKYQKNQDLGFGDILDTGVMMYQSQVIYKTCQTINVAKQSIKSHLHRMCFSGVF